MAIRKPLVLIGGRVQEHSAAADSLENIPELNTQNTFTDNQTTSKDGPVNIINNSGPSTSSSGLWLTHNMDRRFALDWNGASNYGSVRFFVSPETLKTSIVFYPTKVSITDDTSELLSVDTGGLQVGSPTGGAKGADTINVEGGIYSNDILLEAIKHNRAAITNPGTGDDGTAGYAVGSEWNNVTTDEAFVCLDSSTGAAVWKSTTAQSSGVTTAEAEEIAVAMAIALG